MESQMNWRYTYIEHGQIVTVLYTNPHMEREQRGRNVRGDPTIGSLAHQSIEKWLGEKNEFIE